MYKLQEKLKKKKIERNAKKKKSDYMWNFWQNIKLILSSYVWNSSSEMGAGIYWNDVCS